MDISLRKILYIIPLLFLSCGDSQTSLLLERAEHYLPALPDSADSVLKTIENYENLNESDRAL